MNKTFEKTLDNIVMNSELEETVDTLENFKEIYNVFKKEGYEYNEKDFEKEIFDLLREVSNNKNLSESELNSIAGGNKVSTKFISGILGSIAGLSAIFMPQASAVDSNSSNIKNVIIEKVKDVKDFVKTNPLTSAIIGTSGLGTVLISAYLYRYFTNIEHAIEKLDKNKKENVVKIREHIVKLYNNIKNDNSKKDNEKKEIFKSLATKFLNKLLDKKEEQRYSAISDYRLLYKLIIEQEQEKQLLEQIIEATKIFKDEDSLLRIKV